MARYPAAQWRPVPSDTPGGMTSYRFLVLHIMQGTLAGTDTWFSDPANQASSHFGVGRDGTVYQWVDTTDRAWAERAGNPISISIEHEGNIPNALTSAQIAADAAILVWAHQTHGIPLQITNDAVNGSGVCGHSTGAQQDWGHPECPGQAIMDQRQQIVDAATRLLVRPVVTGIDPTGGMAAGGDSVTVTGSNFTGATGVSFGSVAGTNTNVVSDTQVNATSPPSNSSGTVDVTVTTQYGTSAISAADQFTYAPPSAPVVTGVNPASGSAAGGDTVTVTGSGFAGATQVSFGSAAATVVPAASDPIAGTIVPASPDTQIIVTSPPSNTGGTVDVTVTTQWGTSATATADQFTYAPPVA